MVFGLFLIVGLYPMMNWVWPDGWAWEPRQPKYEQIIQGIYAVLGVLLVLASRSPTKHRSLIQFTIWSNVVHATTMAFQAGHDHVDHANFFGDIPALYIMAGALWFFLLGAKATPPAIGESV